MLIKEGYITEDQLKQALAVQQEKGSKLGDVLIQLHFIDEVKLARTLSNQLKLPFIDMRHYPIKKEVITKIPERIARRFRVLLIDISDGGFLVAMADPTDLVAYDELVRILGGKINVAVVVESDVLRVLDLVYRRTEDITSFAQELKEEIIKEEPTVEVSQVDLMSAEAAPVAKLLDSIFEDAVQMGASDIHIEPDEKFLRIRQRIDGVLHEHIVNSIEIIPALVLRIKLIANLNISEKRLPQDGRFHMRMKSHSIDVRVSTMPVYYGESVVMRILDKSTGILEMDQLGMPDVVLERIRSLIHKPYGMVLVTGPTGSGKTTTLYAALSELNTEQDMIITIEDPVEYTLPRINQVQVNQNIGLTFSSVLRSAVRQDPDIVMVGEMRDEETVQIGLRAAVTGHLVLSTLHTNDSISAVTRLLNMGAAGYLVASSLRGILAQRLVRRICDACAGPHIVSEPEKAMLHAILGDKAAGNYQFMQGIGCSRCNQTGYRGRIGVFELLEITDKLADDLRKNDTAAFTNDAAKAPNFKPLTQTAMEYAIKGVTTLEEVFRVAGEV